MNEATVPDGWELVPATDEDQQGYHLLRDGTKVAFIWSITSGYAAVSYRWRDIAGTENGDFKSKEEAARHCIACVKAED